MNQRIIFTNAEGGVSVVIPSGEVPIETLFQQISAQHPGAELVDVSHIPADRTFRNAWGVGEEGKKVGVNLTKAREIGHEKRRAKRAAEFAPLDVEATIPAKAAQAEAKRATIRAKYDAIQTEIDAASTPAALKAIIEREAL